MIEAKSSVRLSWTLPLLALLVSLLSACATPVRVETHAVQAGKMAPGDLEAAFQLVNTAREPESTILIYDASGSMRWPIRSGGEERFGPAHRAMLQFIERTGRQDNVGILVYGSQQPSGVSDGRVVNASRAKTSCLNDIRLVRPLGPAKEQLVIKEKIAYLSRSESYRGDTPIGGALMKAAELLGPVQGPKRVVLLTDGVEECFPMVPGSVNPQEAIKRLNDNGVVVDIVFSGGGLNASGASNARSKDAAQSLRALATGEFFEAGSYEELVDALLRIEIAKFMYELVDHDGKVVAKARIGESITVKSGGYLFRGLTASGFNKRITLPDRKSVV